MTRSAVEGVSNGRHPTTAASQYPTITALDAISTIHGITRILTRCVPSRHLNDSDVAPSRSGQSASAPEGVHVLRELLQRSQTGRGPTILPGAGINPGTVRDVLDSLMPYGLNELHLSGGRWVDGRMVHRCAGMGMGASAEQEWNVWLTDGVAIREVRSIVDNSATSG
jgi:copper homeostasis protein